MGVLVPEDAGLRGKVLAKAGIVQFGEVVEAACAKELPEGGVVVLLDGCDFELQKGILADVTINAVDVVGAFDSQRQHVAPSRCDYDNVVLRTQLKGFFVESGVLPSAVEDNLGNIAFGDDPIRNGREKTADEAQKKANQAFGLSYHFVFLTVCGNFWRCQKDTEEMGLLSEKKCVCGGGRASSPRAREKDKRRRRKQKPIQPFLLQSK